MARLGEFNGLFRSESLLFPSLAALEFEARSRGACACVTFSCLIKTNTTSLFSFSSTFLFHSAFLDQISAHNPLKMPPKKANTKAKATPAKAAVAAEPPATVTTAKGKEIETTAAAGRPRRASAAAEKPAPKVKKTAPVKKAATTKKAESKPSTTKTSEFSVLYHLMVD